MIKKKIKKIILKIKNPKIRKIIFEYLKKDIKNQMWSTYLRELTQKYYGVEIGIGSYGGCYSVEDIPKGTKIGKYCSFAKKIYIFNANHPIDFVSTHPITYNSNLNFVKNEKIKRNKLMIGNDVWVGQNVIILSKVKSIGNGSIIAAGAVVTKDVEPYSIVAGNPAKVIRYRFEKEVIEELEKIKWWDKAPEEILKNSEEMNNVKLYIEREVDE